MLKMEWFLLAAAFLIPHEVLDLQKACKAQFIRKSPRRR